MIHYSQAIKLDPKNYSLYSNRSFTFLMLERYRDALNDALITIRLKPDWSKVCKRIYILPADLDFKKGINFSICLSILGLF